MIPDKECIFCLETNDLINYNHCNKCYIHKDCLKKWFLKNNNLCIICKKKMYKDDDLNNLPFILKSFNIDFSENEIKDFYHIHEEKSNIKSNCYSLTRKVCVTGITFGFICSLYYIIFY